MLIALVNAPKEGINEFVTKLIRTENINETYLKRIFDKADDA